MVLGYYHHAASERTLARAAKTTKTYGTSHAGMVRAARALGLHCVTHERATVAEVRRYITHAIPVIINYRHADGEGHYAVVVGHTPSSLRIHDPYDRRCDSITLRMLSQRWWDVYRTKRSTRWLMAIMPGARTPRRQAKRHTHHP